MFTLSKVVHIHHSSNNRKIKTQFNEIYQNSHNRPPNGYTLSQIQKLNHPINNFKSKQRPNNHNQRSKPKASVFTKTNKKPKQYKQTPQLQTYKEEQQSD